MIKQSKSIIIVFMYNKVEDIPKQYIYINREIKREV